MDDQKLRLRQSPATVVGARCIEHPLREALAHCCGVIGIDLMRLGVFVVVSQVRMVGDDAAPSMQQIVDLVCQNLFGKAQMEDVLFREQRRLFPGSLRLGGARHHHRLSVLATTMSIAVMISPVAV
jgi:hypothetical protein